jgi:hypothetical protein
VTDSERKNMIDRWAKALWKCEVDHGKCSTSWPETACMENLLLAAASAAVGVFDSPIGPLHTYIRTYLKTEASPDELRGALSNIVSH